MQTHAASLKSEKLDNLKQFTTIKGKIADELVRRESMVSKADGEAKELALLINDMACSQERDVWVGGLDVITFELAREVLAYLELTESALKAIELLITSTIEEVDLSVLTNRFLSSSIHL
jgi:hypothetical protein